MHGLASSQSFKCIEMIPLRGFVVLIFCVNGLYGLHLVDSASLANNSLQKQDQEANSVVPQEDPDKANLSSDVVKQVPSYSSCFF